jgi:hypothetical protein
VKENAALRADLAAAIAAKEEAEAHTKRLEEYMLKGVAFRDELQAQLCRAGNVIPQITQFARVMQEKLDRNAHKGGWIKYDTGGNRIWDKDMVAFLKNKLLEEIDELFAEIEFPCQVVKQDLAEEAADVANISMMIADCYGALPALSSSSPCRHAAEADALRDRMKDVEGMAKVLHRYDTAADSLSWEETDEESQGEYLKWADALIKYLTE